MDSHVVRASSLMTAFIERSGVIAGEPRRYLWTDAFAVCTLLGLARATGEGRHLELALVLVDQVHHVLGRYGAGDARHGWISGLGAGEGEAHPTRGGLRIGKPLPERHPDEPLDERREWDRDGQYFHYLTKWMQALDQTARSLEKPLFSTWARELALAAHRGFVHAAPGGVKQMWWKASIDLSRPLVPSMGQHDPLDGLLCCAQLEATAASIDAPGPSLVEAARDFAAMLDSTSLPTADPLGLGGLLVDAYRVWQLARQGSRCAPETLLETLLDAALLGLESFVVQPELRLPSEHRLAFRELGLAIGLAAAELLARDDPARASDPTRSMALRPRLAALARYAPLRDAIQSYWQEPEHQRAASWRTHQDINEVMLATALLPAGYLTVAPLGR